jgi:uncharacterized repeat protein (TIGR02543 family)
LVILIASVFGGISIASPKAVAIEPTMTVTFFENDSSSDPVSSYETSPLDQAEDLYLFTDLTPAFSNPGYTFTGWNTEANGDGTSYADGAQYSFAASIPLYAQWSPLPSATISFNANGGTGNVAPLSDAPGTSISVPSGAGLSLNGYAFAGWNTEADGSGTEIAAGDLLQTATSETLYAQWSPLPAATITFNDNGGVGNETSLSDSPGTSITLPSGTELSFSGYTFAGWNTASDGSGTEYAPGQMLETGSSETLYAQWTQDPQIDISIDANGGSSSVTTLSGVTGATVTLPNSADVEDAGYSLTSWNSAANGSGTSYQPGQAVTFSSSMTLYAQWTALPSSTPPPSSSPPTSSSPTSMVSVNFVTQGGSGSLTTLNDATGTSVTLPSTSSLVREGYTLTSWNTEADGKGTSYKPGESVTLSTSLTLYAQWTPSSATHEELYGAIGDFANISTTLTPSLKVQVREFAAVLKAKRYRVVKLYGYAAATGLVSLDKALSAARASTVANYLRSELRIMKVTGVTISASGEGSVPGKTSSLYSRVEVFVS